MHLFYFPIKLFFSFTLGLQSQIRSQLYIPIHPLKSKVLGKADSHNRLKKLKVES